MAVDQNPHQQDRLYLDHAATGLPKSPAMIAAMTAYLTDLGVTPGRGGYAESIEGARQLERARRTIAALLGERDNPSSLVFTLSATDALNMVIRGMVWHRRRRSDGPIHLVTLASAHNSVIRPLHTLAATPAAGVEVSIVPIDPITGLANPADVRAAIRPNTLMVIADHAGNVTGAIQPVEAMGEICREAGVLFLVDAAQSIGHVAVDVAMFNADAVVFAGHKGLFGPQGTGGVWIKPGAEDVIDTIREGGTGSVGAGNAQPTEMPTKYEPGTPNAPGIIGLAAAVEALGPVADRRAHELELIEAFMVGLAESDRFPGLSLVGRAPAEQRVAVFCVTHKQFSPAELSAVLEMEFGILTRSGLHCAPETHRALGTESTGGATRVCFAATNTKADVERTLDALASICSVVSTAG